MLFFFFNDTATTEIYTLSLHDALPICREGSERPRDAECGGGRARDGERDVHERARMTGGAADGAQDRKSTRLNSSHGYISYAVLCLKKKKSAPTRTPDTSATRGWPT